MVGRLAEQGDGEGLRIYDVVLKRMGRNKSGHFMTTCATGRCS